MTGLPASTQVVVIGAGQAGLAAGYYLRRAGVGFVILDGADEPGGAWRQRWDGLRLFTSTQFCGLPGLDFPGDQDRYAGKDEVADYLAHYARTFALPVHLGHRVGAVTSNRPGFTVVTNRGTIRAGQVIIAAGAFHSPIVPGIAGDLTVPHWHSSQYRNPAQIPAGTVLVVGAGNSGIQIAKELSATHHVVLSRGTPMPEMPQRIRGRDLFWWMEAVGVMRMPVASTIGQRFNGPDPVIGNKIATVIAEGRIRVVGRTSSIRANEVTFADGGSTRTNSVVWATGYRPDWSWLDPSMVDESGHARQTDGIGAVPGSYFLGLYRMRTRGSALLGFVGRDAEHVVQRITGLAAAA